MEDFALFQETVSRTMQLQAISANQVCDFIQQILYYYQCIHQDKSLDFLNYKSELDIFLGVLLQTTMKKLNQTGSCKCNFMMKLNCKHCHKYSILQQHFSGFGDGYNQELMDILDSINHQTCVCSKLASLPMHGPSKFIKEPIPTYEQMQQLHQELDPDLLFRSDLQVLYVNCIISWIYARLYQYITPYTDPSMNKKIGPKGQPFDWEFHYAERAFIENRISMMDMDATYLTQMRGVNQLMDLKKAHCACEVHQADREINLLYQLRLPSSSTNREIIRKVLQEMPHGSSTVISSCQ